MTFMCPPQAGHSVTSTRKLVSVRKRSVYLDYVAGSIQEIEVHGTVSPGPVRIPKCDPGYPTREIAGFPKSETVLPLLP